MQKTTLSFGLDPQQVDDLFTLVDVNMITVKQYRQLHEYIDWTKQKIIDINHVLSLSDECKSQEGKLGFLHRVLVSLRLLNARTVAINRLVITDLEQQASCYALTKLLGDSINQLRKRIHNKIIPKECPYETEPWYNKRLYAQQILITDEKQPFCGLLNTALEAIGEHLDKKHQQYQPEAFIYYAWPTKKLHEQEFWIQHSLAMLREHLSLAGINAAIDFYDFDPQLGMVPFYTSAEHQEFVLLIGSQSLYLTDEQNVGLTKTALHFIECKRLVDQQLGLARIFPIRLSGERLSQFPKTGVDYNDYSPLDAKSISYLTMLKELLSLMLPIDMDNDPALKAIWKPLVEYQDGLFTRPISKSAMVVHLPKLEQHAQQFYQQTDHRFAQVQNIMTSQVSPEEMSSYRHITDTLQQTGARSVQIISRGGQATQVMQFSQQIGSVGTHVVSQGPTSLTFHYGGASERSSKGDQSNATKTFTSNK